MSWRSGLSTFLLMAVMGMGAAAWAQNGPTEKDLEKNGGSYGKKPVEAPGQAVTTEVKPAQVKWDKDKKKKKAPLECGVEYTVSVTLTEAAKCGDWADGNLLQKATDECHALLETYDCEDPQKCRPYSWYDYFDTGCTDNMAYARVDGTVKCAEENDKEIHSGYYPEGVSEVGGYLQKNHKYTKGVAITPGDNGQATTIVYPKPLKCGTSQLVSYTVNFVTPIAEFLKHGNKDPMAKVDSFTQFYGVALKEAEAYYTGIAACDDPAKCRKEAFAVVYSTWSASDDTVTITVYFDVTCKPK